MILSKIVGALIMLIGSSKLLYAIWYIVMLVPIRYYIVQISLYLLLYALIIYIGFRLLCIKKTIYYINKVTFYIKNREKRAYEKEQQRHEKALEKAEQLALKRQEESLEEAIVNNEEKEKDNTVALHKPRKEGYIDIPAKGKKQEIQIHLCASADAIWKIVHKIAIVLAVGSLVSTVAFCYLLSEEDIGVFAFLMTVLFWIGVMLFFSAKGHINGETDVVFITTDQKLIYRMDLGIMFNKNLHIPLSRVGRLVYMQEKEEEVKEIRSKINAILQDRQAIRNYADEVINPKREEDGFIDGMIKKLNSPGLVKRPMRTFIKYWDESRANWALVPLPKGTEEYTMICEMIKSRNM